MHFVKDSKHSAFFLPPLLPSSCERMTALLDKGVPVDSQDNYGYTALHYAASACSEEACQLLLARNACPASLTAAVEFLVPIS